MALCVLTGDIVGSTALSRAKLLRAQAVLVTINQLVRTDTSPAAFDLHRGDGWQAAFEAPQIALRYALCFTAALRNEDEHFSTRIALAVGTEPFTSQSVNSEQSAAFVASGRTLDAMPDDQRFAHASGGALHAATLLADHISRGWTQAQARAILPFLMPTRNPTQKDVAAEIGISRQAVGQALDAAGYPAIKAALIAIEEQA